MLNVLTTSQGVYVSRYSYGNFRNYHSILVIFGVQNIM